MASKNICIVIVALFVLMLFLPQLKLSAMNTQQDNGKVRGNDQREAGCFAALIRCCCRRKRHRQQVEEHFLTNTGQEVKIVYK